MQLLIEITANGKFCVTCRFQSTEFNEEWKAFHDAGKDDEWEGECQYDFGCRLFDKDLKAKRVGKIKYQALRCKECLACAKRAEDEKQERVKLLQQIKENL